jgi:hypothetical protein
MVVEHSLLAELLFSLETGKCALLRWINFARRIPSGLYVVSGDEQYSRKRTQAIQLRIPFYQSP